MIDRIRLEKAAMELKEVERKNREKRELLREIDEQRVQHKNIKQMKDMLHRKSLQDYYSTLVEQNRRKDNIDSQKRL
jgi:hypothetical protein